VTGISFLPVLVAGTFYGTVPNRGTICACRLVVVRAILPIEQSIFF